MAEPNRDHPRPPEATRSVEGANDMVSSDIPVSLDSPTSPLPTPRLSAEVRWRSWPHRFWVASMPAGSRQGLPHCPPLPAPVLLCELREPGPAGGTANAAAAGSTAANSLTHTLSSASHARPVGFERVEQALL